MIKKNILESKEFQEALNSLPENERENMKKNFEDLIDLFENKLFIPLKNVLDNKK